MTREDAIKELKILKEEYWDDDGYGHETKQYDDTMFALDMAINTLEQESCEDCISREDTKQFLYERLDRLNDDELYDIFSRIIDDMYNELPSVTPKAEDDNWDDYSFLKWCSELLKAESEVEDAT